MKLAVFDVCGTLYCCNTLFSFIRWKQCPLCTADSLPAKALDRLLRPLHLPLRRYLYVRTLRGMDVADAQNSARVFAQQVLSQCERDSAVTLLKQMRENGWHIVLLSGSADFIVREVAKEFQADGWLASTLEQKDGRFTGRFFDCLAGRKQELLDRFGEYDELFVCTDNRDDLPLLRLSQSRRIYSPKRLADFWIRRGFAPADLCIEEYPHADPTRTHSRR